MADVTPRLRAAVERALAGDWQAAHAIVQEHEGEAMADWIHGVVHWMEGDLSNARYWFGQAGRRLGDYPDTGAALRAIETALGRRP